jgi:hypothetical protein
MWNMCMGSVLILIPHWKQNKHVQMAYKKCVKYRKFIWIGWKNKPANCGTSRLKIEIFNELTVVEWFKVQKITRIFLSISSLDKFQKDVHGESLMSKRRRFLNSCFFHVILVIWNRRRSFGYMLVRWEQQTCSLNFNILLW